MQAGKPGLKSVAFAVALLLLATCSIVAGCGGGDDPTAWLERCRQAVYEYIQEGSYLHFVQESEYRLSMAEGDLEQKVNVEGDVIFINRESYEYTETLSSPQQAGMSRQNAFSYLTLDGGKTAYVMGERLAQELGILGWIHYTPPQDQNRYFNYYSLIDSLTVAGIAGELMGYEEVDGVRCAHMSYTVSGQDLFDLRIQEDPAFAEKYEGVDIEGILAELKVEMWIGEQDSLPRKITMDQSATMEEDLSTVNRLLFVFSGYGEEAPLLIEEPALFTEAA